MSVSLSLAGSLGDANWPGAKPILAKIMGLFGRFDRPFSDTLISMFKVDAAGHLQYGAGPLTQ